MLLETENPNIEEVYGETPLKKKKKNLVDVFFVLSQVRCSGCCITTLITGEPNT